MVLLRFLTQLPRFYLWTLIFEFQMTIYLGDILAWRILRYHKKSKYVRRGQCQRTGLCCQTLGVELPKSWVRRRWIVALFNAWYSYVHRFESIGPPQGQLLPLSCQHLRGGNLCSIYPYRPKLCREFPQMRLLGHIGLHKGCGFWFLERKDLGTFSEKLKQQEHEAERREYLASLQPSHAENPPSSVPR